MVWARTKLTLWDNVFEPIKQIQVTYTGETPSKFYNKINELIRTIFNVPEGYVQEKTYDWKRSDNSQTYNVLWEVNKLLDQYSFIMVEIDLKGYEKDGTGKASIRIKPRLITEYPQDTLWQQNIFYEILRRFWHSVFYHGKRMEYLDKARELVTNFESNLKRFGEKMRES